MKANEMRIGNWYDSGHFGDYYQMTGKDIWEFEADPIDDIYYPIPLTEEWLLKFGFKYNSDKGWLSIKTKKLFIGYNIKYEYFKITELDEQVGIIKRSIKDVHSLQNLYHSLTGEELKVREQVID